ncbi:MAG: hypothetical protein H6825_13180, partial [Planctomycetes bacterium]|nr:hypothetical protein [Planctomycetota bacterium]
VLGFVVLAFPIGLLLLSGPGTKRPLYLLPLLAPVAVAYALWLAATFERGRRAGVRVAGTLFVLALIGQLALPLVRSDERDMRVLADDLREGGLLDARLAGWRLDERTRAVVPWYTGHIVPNLREADELEAFVHAHPDARLLMDLDRIELLPAPIAAALVPGLRWDFDGNRYGTFSVGP